MAELSSKVALATLLLLSLFLQYSSSEHHVEDTDRGLTLEDKEDKNDLMLTTISLSDLEDQSSLKLLERVKRQDADTTTEPQELHLGVIWPRSTFLDRRFTRVLSATLLKIGRKNNLYEFLKKYKVPTPVKVPFQIYPSPLEILDALMKEFIPKKVAAILFLRNYQKYGRSTGASQYFLQLTGYLKMPVIAWNADNIGQQSQKEQGTLQVQMAPSLEHQVEAMLSLLERYKWHQFAVVTSTIAGHANFIQIVRDMTTAYKTRFSLTINNIITVSETKNLSELAESEARIMLLYATREEADAILVQAREYNLTGKNYVWIATQSVINDGETSRNMHPGMLGVSFETDDKALENQIENAVKVFINGVEDFTKKYPNESLANRDPGGGAWDMGNLFYKSLTSVSIPQGYGEKPVEFLPDGTLKYTSLRIMNLRLNRERRKQWTQIGTWRSGLEEGLELDDIVWPGNSHIPPEGVPEKFHMRIAFMEERPFINMELPNPKTGQCSVDKGVLCYVGAGRQNITDPEWQCCSGFCIDLLKKLQAELPFTFDLFRAEDGKWGTEVHGEWNGLVKEILDDRADMVLSPFQVNSDRMAVLDFSVPFLDTAISIIVAKRTGLVSPTAFLEPFDPLSWMLVIFVFIQVAAVTIFVYEWLSPLGYDRKLSPPRDHKFSLFRCYWLVWAFLFQAAVDVDCPRGYTARFMANLWALFAMIFLAIYTANLTAFMITREDFYDLKGVEDPRLLDPLKEDERPFRFATIPYTNTETILKHEHPQYQYMKTFNRSSVNDAIHSIKSGELDAFIYDATILDYQVGQDSDCQLLSVGSWYARTGYALAFKKGSKRLEKFNEALLKFREDGEIDRLSSFWLTASCKRGAEATSGSKPLSVSQFLSVFFLLGAGIFAGLLFMLLEHVYFRYLRKYLARTDYGGCCALISLSMGKSLSFHGAVMEAHEVLKFHKCDDIRCEAQMNLLRQDLDLTRIQLARLEKECKEKGVELPEPSVSYPLDDLAPPALPSRHHSQASITDVPQVQAVTKRKRRGDGVDEEKESIL